VAKKCQVLSLAAVRENLGLKTCQSLSSLLTEKGSLVPWNRGTQAPMTARRNLALQTHRQEQWSLTAGAESSAS
jgi:hypothetical protein